MPFPFSLALCPCHLFNNRHLCVCGFFVLLLLEKCSNQHLPKRRKKTVRKFFIYLFFSAGIGIHLKSTRFFSSRHESGFQCNRKVPTQTVNIPWHCSISFRFFFSLVSPFFVCVRARLSTQAQSFSIFHLLCSEFIHFLCAVCALLIRIRTADVLRHTRTTWKGVKIGKLYQLNEAKKKSKAKNCFSGFEYCAVSCSFFVVV